MSGQTNSVEQLLGQNTGGPHSNFPVHPTEVARTELSKNIVFSNYVDIQEFVDSEIAGDDIVVVHNENAKAVARTLFTCLHNYLSSLYSYNEQVRDLINEKTNAPQITKQAHYPHLGDTPRCDYVEKLVFLIGLRHSIQHGDFQCLDFRVVDETRGFQFRELTFDQSKFQNGQVDHPESHTQYGNGSDMGYPLTYIREFHQNQFIPFAQECVDWLEGNP